MRQAPQLEKRPPQLLPRPRNPLPPAAHAEQGFPRSPPPPSSSNKALLQRAALFFLLAAFARTRQGVGLVFRQFFSLARFSVAVSVFHAFLHPPRVDALFLGDINEIGTLRFSITDACLLLN
jgi:hypothetical protein